MTGRDPGESPSSLWGTLAAVAVAGVLLLALFVGRAGSEVGLTAALLIAAALGVASIVLRMARTRRPGAAARARRPAPQPASGPFADLDLGEPVDPEPRPAAAPPRRPTAPPDPVSPPRPAAPLPFLNAQLTGGHGAGHPPELPERLRTVATEMALASIAQIDAPAAAVLVPLGGRLVPAGTAGDWAAARRALKDMAIPGLYDPTTDDGTPPDFALDPRHDGLERLLALYPSPVPLERWHELSDVPEALLPLVGLAAAGTAVALPVTHRRRLAGMWLLAQRSGDNPYTDAELTTLLRLGRDSAGSLADALQSAEA